MVKKYTKKSKSTQKKLKKTAREKSKKIKSVQKTKKTTSKSKKFIKKGITSPAQKADKEGGHHKFKIISALEFKDVMSRVMLLKNGKYGALSEDGSFLIFTINNKSELKPEISFNFPGANYFGQLNNGIVMFNNFDIISFWELKGDKMNKVGEYETMFKLVVYFMEPIGENFCAISGPNNIIELIEFNKNKKIKVNYLDFTKSKLYKNKKIRKKQEINFGPEITGCLYYQKNKNKLLAAHCSENILRIWDCDIKNNKYELFKEVDNINTFTGKVIHEINNKIIIGGKSSIVLLNNNNYEIESFIPLGLSDLDIFSMEVIKYYSFKEFVVCGMRNGKIMGVDIENKKVEFSKQKIGITNKDNELNIKDGKISFYGENVASIIKVENKNMILVASHDHTLKLIEY